MIVNEPAPTGLFANWVGLRYSVGLQLTRLIGNVLRDPPLHNYLHSTFHLLDYGFIHLYIFLRGDFPGEILLHG
jgi:hypothetical protein